LRTEAIVLDCRTIRGAPALNTAEINLKNNPSGAKARAFFQPFAARLKSCPDTIQGLALGTKQGLAPDTKQGVAPDTKQGLALDKSSRALIENRYFQNY
jgi:hypothetical protein